MNREHIPRDKLTLLYIDEERTVREISEMLNASVGKIHKFIKLYGLTRDKYTQRAKDKMHRNLCEWHNTHTSPMRGKHLSDETRQKISASHKGKQYKPSQYGGHIKQRADGYIYVYVPNHPYASKDGYVMEHILTMERVVGRYITRDEVVHHINHVRNDNRIENLQLMTFKEHASLHMRERQAKKRGVMTYQ